MTKKITLCDESQAFPKLLINDGLNKSKILY
jgi:hypothetical protein